MKQIKLSTDIDRPREEVFAYLADIANLAEFHDHYITDWHLLRENTKGAGAGVRAKLKAPANRFSWAEMSYVEVATPERIVGRGAGGKYNRIHIDASYELSVRDDDKTHLEYTLSYDPKLPSDKLYWAFPGGGWLRGKSKRSLSRLKSILENDSDSARGVRPVAAMKRAA